MFDLRFFKWISPSYQRDQPSSSITMCSFEHCENCVYSTIFSPRCDCACPSPGLSPPARQPSRAWGGKVWVGPG